LKQLPEKLLQIRLGRFSRRVAIRSNQPIVDEHFDLAAIESKLSFQKRFRFQARKRGERRARGLLQAILIAAVERGLAIVANAQAIIGVVHAVIALVTDQHDAGARMARAGNRLRPSKNLRTPALRSTVERSESARRGQARRLGDEQLHVDVLQLHTRRSFSQPCGEIIVLRIANGLDAYRRAQPIVTTVRGVDEKLGFVDQVAAGIWSVRLVRFLVRVEQIIRKFAARERIPEFLRVVVARAEFGNDAVGIVRKYSGSPSFTSALAPCSMAR
jgi:hypothetical protein